MNILLVSAELAPFAKVGGLADISGALPIGWKRIGHNPIIVIPKYKGIEEQFHILKTDITITFTLFGKQKCSMIIMGRYNVRFDVQLDHQFKCRFA